MFKQYSLETAPENSKEFLQKVVAKFGLIPNQDKILAASPAIYQAYIQSFDLFLGKSTLGLLEGQLVIMTVSYENNSPYCMAVHTWGMEMTKVPTDVIEALRNGTPIQDKRLETLRNFTRELMVQKGHLAQNTVDEFIAAGFTHENIIEIIGGIATKLIANFTNSVANTPLDEVAKKYEWKHPKIG